MTYTPVSHTLQGFNLTGGAVGVNFPPMPPTTNTAFIAPAFTLQQNVIGSSTPLNFPIANFGGGSFVGPAIPAMPMGRPSFGQLYPR